MISPIELELVFWQRIVSIHQAPLIVALAEVPGVKVTYVAEETTSESRRALGWVTPSLGAADFIRAESKQAVAGIVAQFPDRAIHLCQGIRDNGLVGVAQRHLQRRKARVVILSETVDDDGGVGVVKRLIYRLSILSAARWVDCILAIGESTPNWYMERRFPRARVFPFCYFLDASDPVNLSCAVESNADYFHIAFIGNIIKRKRLDLLIEALQRLPRDLNFKLTIVGTGPLEQELRRVSVDRLDGKVIWKGMLSSDEVPLFLAKVDCLVLPSRHDGWGAVVSEALLVGTPVICSDRCGAAVAVRQSRAGGVFRSGDREGLMESLLGVMSRGLGRTAERFHLAAWAKKSLSGPAGARYLIEILRHRFAGAKRPFAPFLDPRF